MPSTKGPSSGKAGSPVIPAIGVVVVDAVVLGVVVDTAVVAGRSVVVDESVVVDVEIWGASAVDEVPPDVVPTLSTWLQAAAPINRAVNEM